MIWQTCTSAVLLKFKAAVENEPVQNSEWAITLHYIDADSYSNSDVCIFGVEMEKGI